MGAFCCCVSNSSANDVREDLDQKRGCTDVFWLLLFIVFMAGMGYILYGSLDKGDPDRLVYGVDTWGNTCNRENTAIEGATLSGRDMKDKMYTYYFNFLGVVQPKLYTSTVLCVSSCPTDFLLTDEQVKNFSADSGLDLCRYDIDSEDFVSGSLSSDECPPLPIVPHKPLLNRCVPITAMTVGTSILQTAAEVGTQQVDSFSNHSASGCDVSTDIVQRIINDLNHTRYEVAYLSGGSVGAAFLITILMRFFAFVIIWVIIIGMAVGSVGGAAYCWYTYFDFNGKLSDIPKADRTEADEDYVKYWFYGAIAVTSLAIVVLLLLLIMRKRIALVVQLFSEAGKAVAKMPMLLLQPVWTLIALIGFLCGLGYGFLYLLSAGSPMVDSSGHVTYEGDDTLFYMKWYYLFGILWVVQFVFASQMIIIAGATATWYFTRDKSELGCCAKRRPILDATWRFIRYHLGTVAFGSFIIAVVQLVRIILMYIQRQLRGKTTKVVVYLLKILACCFWCLEKILKFFTKNAYIMVAIYGCNLCSGGMRAIKTILNNVLRVGTINSLGTFTLFVGKALVVAVMVIAGLQLLKDDPEICYLSAPLVVIGVASYLVAHCFLGVYGKALDTIFMCFCIDCEQNNGGERPYFMNKGLMKFVDRASRKYSRDNASTSLQNSNRNNPQKLVLSRPAQQGSRPGKLPKGKTRRIEVKPSTDVEW